jgi:hypothetical protein
MSQVGAILKTDSPQNPLTFAAKAVYGEGWSQTGGYALRYINTFGPLAEMSDGSHVYDGWLVGGATGPSAINQCSPSLSSSDPRQQIHPNGVPVIFVRTQGDFFSFPYRRDDGDAPDDQFRLYELAGPTHDTTTIFENFAPDEDIIKAGVAPPDPTVCNYEYITDFPYEYYFNAAAEHLKRWAVDGVSPPHADRMLYDENNQNLLDQYGNAMGGVRSPYLDVPIATYHMGGGGVFTCRVLGYKTPFSEELLKELYPSHGRYVSQVVQSTNALVAQGFLTHYNADDIKTEASHADVP